MHNKIIIPLFAAAVILYFILKYTNADEQIVNFVGGISIGILLSVVGAWIFKLFTKKKE